MLGIVKTTIFFMSQELKEYIEQVVKFGNTANLTSAQLLSIIIEKGDKTRSQYEIAEEIVTCCGEDLSLILDKNFDTILKRTMLPGRYGMKLAAIMELTKRVKRSPDKKVEYIYSSSDSYKLLAPLYNNLNHEEFWVVLLNNSLRVVDIIKVGEGGLDSTLVDVKKIIKGAIGTLASKIILSHNHLAPNPTPSKADDKATIQVSKAAILFDIIVTDHIIVGEAGYYSYNDNNKIISARMREELTPIMIEE